MTYLSDIYEATVKGVAQMAHEGWQHARGMTPNDDEAMDMLYTGRCQAYADVLRLLTGCNQPDKWLDRINAMSSSRGVVATYYIDRPNHHSCGWYWFRPGEHSRGPFTTEVIAGKNALIDAGSHVTIRI